MSRILQCDILPEHWLVIVESDGPNGLGMVLAYAVVETKDVAAEIAGRGISNVCDMFGLFDRRDIPDDVTHEIMTCAEFRECYGDRMPLRNRLMEEPS